MRVEGLGPSKAFLDYKESIGGTFYVLFCFSLKEWEGPSTASSKASVSVWPGGSGYAVLEVGLGWKLHTLGFTGLGPRRCKRLSEFQGLGFRIFRPWAHRLPSL